MKNVQVDFGAEINADRLAKKELGGGACLDIGIYCLQLSQFIFGGEKPKQISAIGHLNKEGVDENVGGSLMYSNGRLTTFQFTSKVEKSDFVTLIFKGSNRIPIFAFRPIPRARLGFMEQMGR